MFHVGHLNLINRAKEHCEYLIVGVNSDEQVHRYKNKYPVISQEDRAQIVRNIKAVDDCIIVETLDKLEVWKDVKFDAIFIGDDWKGNPRWLQTEEQLRPYGVDVIYLPYTPNISSTILREKKDNNG